MTTINAAAEAARKVREWTARRDDLMAQASAEGHSWREIGAACGMSHAGAKRAAGRATAGVSRDQ